MARDVDQRVADVRRLLGSARAVWDKRAQLGPVLSASTGLTAEGVELGFASLERDATDDELRALVVGAGNARCVHVILSANVFVTPLRALALARAAADRVTIRPSPREPHMTRALLLAAGDEAMTMTDDRDIGRVDADEIHVYGRDETIAAVRATARGGVRVRGHGAGMGVAVVTLAATLSTAAEHIASDVVRFDQRGCLSPRLVAVEGGPARASEVARAIDEALHRWGHEVPRGTLSESERGNRRRWLETLAFSGTALTAGPSHALSHAVGLAPAGAPPLLAPPGRHVLVSNVEALDHLDRWLSHLTRFVVAVGTDDVARVRPFAPQGARMSLLGFMQRPPLDGPVDRRA